MPASLTEDGHTFFIYFCSAYFVRGAKEEGGESLGSWWIGMGNHVVCSGGRHWDVGATYHVDRAVCMVELHLISGPKRKQ